MIGASLIVAAALVAMQTWVVRKTGSTAIAADRAHYTTDVAVNAGVLLALVVAKFTGWQRADPGPAPASCVSRRRCWQLCLGASARDSAVTAGSAFPVVSHSSLRQRACTPRPERHSIWSGRRGMECVSRRLKSCVVTLGSHPLTSFGAQCRDCA